MEALQNILSQIPTEGWYALIGAPVVSFVLQKLKKWLSLQSEKVVVFLLFVLSFIGAVVTFVAGSLEHNPMFLGPQTAVIVSASVFFYHTIGKPFTNLVRDAKALREGTVTTVTVPTTAAGAAAVSATETTTPAPAIQTDTAAPDFSA